MTKNIRNEIEDPEMRYGVNELIVIQDSASSGPVSKDESNKDGSFESTRK